MDTPLHDENNSHPYPGSLYGVPVVVDDEQTWVTAETATLVDAYTGVFVRVNQEGYALLAPSLQAQLDRIEKNLEGLIESLNKARALR